MLSFKQSSQHIHAEFHCYHSEFSIYIYRTYSLFKHHVTIGGICVSENAEDEALRSSTPLTSKKSLIEGDALQNKRFKDDDEDNENDRNDGDYEEDSDGDSDGNYEEDGGSTLER